MKPYATVGIAGLGLALAAAQALAFDNEPQGFRGIDWGAPIVSVENQFIRISGAGKEGFYLRASDTLEMDGARLKSIVYRFYDGRFFGVVLYAARGNAFKFIEAFRARFGPGTQPDPQADKYVWAGEDSEIILFCKKVVDDCHAVIRSAEAAKQEAAEETGTAMKDF